MKTNQTEVANYFSDALQLCIDHLPKSNNDDPLQLPNKYMSRVASLGAEMITYGPANAFIVGKEKPGSRELYPIISRLCGIPRTQDGTEEQQFINAIIKGDVSLHRLSTVLVSLKQALRCFRLDKPKNNQPSEKQGA